MFSLLQFNILANGLSALRPDKGGFIKCPEEYLEWDYRREKLVAEVLKSKADIICIEEVDHYEV